MESFARLGKLRETEHLDHFGGDPLGKFLHTEFVSQLLHRRVRRLLVEDSLQGGGSTKGISGRFRL
jgi:hypothetical protein